MSELLVSYQQWLTKQQSKPAFHNSYWCAMLAYDMEENGLTEGFKIPYFILEEELEKEEHRDEQNGSYISDTLRYLIIHLLKAYNEETIVPNYEEVLRDFLEKANVLDVGVDHPLTPSTSFHSLPTVCKLWILCALRNYKMPIRHPRPLAKDALGNAYFLVSDCRLYVRLAQPDNITLPIDEERLREQQWGSLYKYLHIPCVLLCENQVRWDGVGRALQNYKLHDLHYEIWPEMAVKLSGLNLVMTARDEQRRAFQEELSNLVPVPKTRKPKKPKKKANTFEGNGNADDVTPNSDLEAMNIKDATTNPTPSEVKRIVQLRRRIEKCWQFPQCPLDYKCPYVHPKFPCSKFPNCARGWECVFLHDFCPNDEDCEEPNCAYEHVHSTPTYYRMVRPATTNPRPVASVPPVMRTQSIENNKKLSEESTGTPSTPVSGQSPVQLLRCGFFPQCRFRNRCSRVHPTQDCKKLAAGENCSGQWCLFKHGACAKDGECEDLNCIYEHYKSSPVMARILARKKEHAEMKNNPGSLSRANSVGNLSTCSVRSSVRRKSVTFDVDSDDEGLPIKKESALKKPAGILRPSGANSHERCKFGPRCTNKTCEFAHPREKCPAFPKCPNGGACFFLHDVCERDGVCCRENCDYEHYFPHEISNSWCKNGSRCKLGGCMLIHPKECVGRCPTPNDCWMYHRPAALAAAAPPQAPPSPIPARPAYPQQPLRFAQSSEMPPGPGHPTFPPPFGAMPYDFGPQPSYPANHAAYPPGSGFGPGGRMNPHVFAPSPGFQQGFQARGPFEMQPFRPYEIGSRDPTARAPGPPTVAPHGGYTSPVPFQQPGTGYSTIHRESAVTTTTTSVNRSPPVPPRSTKILPSPPPPYSNQGVGNDFGGLSPELRAFLRAKGEDEQNRF